MHHKKRGSCTCTEVRVFFLRGSWTVAELLLLPPEGIASERSGVGTTASAVWYESCEFNDANLAPLCDEIVRGRLGRRWRVMERRWQTSLRPSFFFPLSGFDRSYQPLPLPWCAAVVRHASLSKVAAQSDVFLLLPWLYFMPSCLFSSSHPLVFFSLSVILTKKKKERKQTQKLKLQWSGK